MKKTPRQSGAKEVRSKNSHKPFTSFSPPLQARRILKTPPPWRLAGDVADRVVSRIWLDDA